VIRNVRRKNHARALQLNVDGAEVPRVGALEAAPLTGRDRGVRLEDLQLDEEVRLVKDIVQEAHVIARRVIEIAGYRRHPVDLIIPANDRRQIVLGKLKPLLPNAISQR